MKYILLPLVALCLASCGKKDAPAALSTPAASGNHDATGPVTEATLGVKFYPGARLVTSGETPDLVSANLETSDSGDKVAAFYEAELGTKAVGTMIKGQKDGKLIVVVTSPSGSGTAMSIMRKK